MPSMSLEEVLVLGIAISSVIVIIISILISIQYKK